MRAKMNGATSGEADFVLVYSRGCFLPDVAPPLLKCTETRVTISVFYMQAVYRTDLNSPEHGTTCGRMSSIFELWGGDIEDFALFHSRVFFLPDVAPPLLKCPEARVFVSVLTLKRSTQMI
jgi:hypothetical protein